MRPNEAIASTIKSTALQRALDIKRSAETKGDADVLWGYLENGKGIVIETSEDHENIPTIKSFEIDMKGKAKVGMLEENPS
ncbi:hypothetical protein RND71_009304 [Anisodus tanguticus]|uniref:Uncharacterized protein n=1 Tax=Anisodus tanguticus TaxID=243964 RepID=A0AAE1SHS3_9SOLA|nr:hypothetical protein RND71_009304 [Anisodus tanguticus]